MKTTRSIRRRPGRDEGSVLLYVLILIIVGSMIVLPLMNFALSVGRHNSVLTEKVRRQEAVKAGLRTALADPKRLYNHCADTSATLGGAGIDGIGVTSKCEFLSFSLAASEEELHLGLVATRVGEKIPGGLIATVEKDAMGQPVRDTNGNPVRYVYEPQTTDTHEWLDPAAAYAVQTTSQPKHIWSPLLPVHARSLRGSLGFEMPDGYPTCTVYFPGTYTNPVVLDGPTYFTSGIYYFENTITVGANADVVVGMGQNEGCTNDQEAAFYAVNAPATHNISGLGGTFVLGYDSQFVITNASGSPKIHFNQRYVNDTDEVGLPSFGVSIVSVNGRLPIGATPTAGGEYTQTTDLLVAGVDEVPMSYVVVPRPTGDDGTGPPPAPIQAGMQNYRPSKLTHEPRPPSAPLGATTTAPPTAVPYKTILGGGAAKVTWTPPAKLGGQPVTQYQVSASGSGGQFCSTTGALECIVTGLTIGTNYTFTVTATNSIGTSVASAPTSSVKPLSTSSVVDKPSTPAAPTAVRYPDNTVVVSWTAPNANNSTITSYTVSAAPAIDPVTRPCVFISPTSCLIRNLPVLDPDDPLDLLDTFSDYVFSVTATNEMGTSLASLPSATLILIPAATGASPADPTPTPPVVVPPYEPDPILFIDLPSANPVTIDIPGYVAVPMGIVTINNPNGLGRPGDGNVVSVSGGIIAAGFRVSDGRENPGDGELTVPIGLVNPVVQRTYKIITKTTTGKPTITSTAIVQINQNGAYAVNSWEVQ